MKRHVPVLQAPALPGPTDQNQTGQQSTGPSVHFYLLNALAESTGWKYACACAALYFIRAGTGGKIKSHLYLTRSRSVKKLLNLRVLSS